RDSPPSEPSHTSRRTAIYLRPDRQRDSCAVYETPAVAAAFPAGPASMRSITRRRGVRRSAAAANDLDRLTIPPMETTQSPPVTRLRSRLCLGPRSVTAIVAVLLVIFAVLSYSAVRTKSAAFDEPAHALAAYVYRFHRDARLAPEDPPLFAYWAALPHGSSELKLDFEQPSFRRTLDYSPYRFGFVVSSLYQTPGNDADGFLNRSRVMFVLLGVTTGTLLAWWSWKLAGGLAALAA